MIPFYENRDRELQVGHSVNMQFPPHLHGEVELLYVYSGALEVLVGQNVYLLEEGDFAAIFPNCVHSYRTPPEESSAVCLVIVQPRLAGEFSSSLQKLHPLDPVVRRAALHRGRGRGRGRGAGQMPRLPRPVSDSGAGTVSGLSPRGVPNTAGKFCAKCRKSGACNPLFMAV